jgi:acetyltransferase
MNNPSARQTIMTNAFCTAPSPQLHQGPAARNIRLQDSRRVVARIANIEDSSAVQQFVRGLSDNSRRNRFCAPIRELSPYQLERLTRSRPPNELVIVGETHDNSGSRIVAMAQYAGCDALEAEFAVVVDDAWQRQGLAIELLSMLDQPATRAGFTALVGFVLPDNRPMLALLARLEWRVVTDCDPYLLRAVKRLDRLAPSRPRMHG